MPFAVYFHSENDRSTVDKNKYGWVSKGYVVKNGITYPVCSKLEEDISLFRFEKQAINFGLKYLNQCPEIKKFEVIKYPDQYDDFIANINDKNNIVSSCILSYKRFKK